MLNKDICVCSVFFIRIDRLSALPSSRLRANNQNLTDLSDPNRPTKIAQMFSELYDNEWIDAFDELNKTLNEEDTTEQLNELIMVYHFYPQNWARQACATRLLIRVYTVWHSPISFRHIKS